MSLAESLAMARLDADMLSAAKPMLAWLMRFRLLLLSWFRVFLIDRQEITLVLGLVGAIRLRLMSFQRG